MGVKGLTDPDAEEDVGSPLTLDGDHEHLIFHQGSYYYQLSQLIT